MSSNNLMEVKQEDTSGNGLPSSIKSYQDGQKQQLQSSNYASACQWAAEKSPHMVPQITSSSQPPKEPIRPKGDRIGADEIQVVQNHIEKCLQLYMNQTEVITALVSQANIEPGFTNLVWQKLEEQNPEFFRGYHVRLRVKEQITAFNYLATQQFQALQKSNPAYFQSTTTVPGNFSFRTPEPLSSTSSSSLSTPSLSTPSLSTPALSTSSASSSTSAPSTTSTNSTHTPPTNSQQPRSPQPPPPGASKPPAKAQLPTKQQPQQPQPQPQKPGHKKDDFLDTNIYFEQPS
eukprot:Phypoly_transcript_11943.p1 GENE.Phypoly_transcript_11943~~Phypoly_transcript_11943.p1  ORF type:complete len:290 (-),score=82.06 Phypoly_transcript_11943:232-1101(-)